MVITIEVLGVVANVSICKVLFELAAVIVGLVNQNVVPCPILVVPFCPFTQEVPLYIKACPEAGVVTCTSANCSKVIPVIALPLPDILPALMLPLTPKPPVITNAPVVVFVLLVPEL